MSRFNTLSYKEWKKITNGVGRGLLSMLLDHWERVFTSVFEWKTGDLDMPELGRHIERQLYGLGSTVFFKSSTGIIGALPYANQGGLNWYGEPVSWKVIGANGYNENFNLDNSVMIRANKNRASDFSYVHEQVRRLVNIEGAIDVNINQLKVPFFFSGSEASLLTMKNVYKKLADNEPVIYLDKEFSANNKIEGKAIPTGVNYHGAELMQLYNDIEGRLLKIAGLKYVHTEKKERLIVDEVNSNDGLSNTYLFDKLNERQIACKKINKMFGLNISVNINPLLMLSDPDKNGENEESEGEESE